MIRRYADEWEELAWWVARHPRRRDGAPPRVTRVSPTLRRRPGGIYTTYGMGAARPVDDDPVVWVGRADNAFWAPPWYALLNAGHAGQRQGPEPGFSRALFAMGPEVRRDLGATLCAIGPQGAVDAFEAHAPELAPLLCPSYLDRLATLWSLSWRALTHTGR